MKRIAAAVIAFVAVLSVGIVSNLYFDTTCKAVEQELGEAIRQARSGDYTAAATSASKAEEFWVSRRKLLSFTVNHGFLYEIDTRITGLAALSTHDAKEEFLASAEQATEALAYVRREK